MNFSEIYLKEISNITKRISLKKIDEMVDVIAKCRKNKGRIFFAGVGGSAGNCSHAVNDFRKLCKVEAYAITDNVSEITARTNDEGFETIFDQYLITSNFSKNDILFIFSVGGGNYKKNVSVNLINAIKLSKRRKAKVLGIVGKKNGYTYKNGDVVLDIDTKEKKLITPISEAYQAVIWHLLVSHPILAKNKTTW